MIVIANGRPRSAGSERACEIWLGDSDVVLVPESEILQAGDFIKLMLTRSIYRGIPSSASYEFGLTALVLK